MKKEVNTPFKALLQLRFGANSVEAASGVDAIKRGSENFDFSHLLLEIF